MAEKKYIVTKSQLNRLVRKTSKPQLSEAKRNALANKALNEIDKAINTNLKTLKATLKSIVSNYKNLGVNLEPEEVFNVIESELRIDSF